MLQINMKIPTGKETKDINRKHKWPRKKGGGGPIMLIHIKEMQNKTMRWNFLSIKLWVEWEKSTPSVGKRCKNVTLTHY